LSWSAFFPLPSRPAPPRIAFAQSDVAVRASDVELDCLAFALIQAGLHLQAFLRDELRQFRGLESGQPGVELTGGSGFAGGDLLLHALHLDHDLLEPRAVLGDGTVMIGGVSCTLPSIAFCVVLLKNAASE
jgi:hypothetical protein